MTEVASQDLAISQMSTQSLKGTQEFCSQSLGLSQESEEVWGRLLAMRDKIKGYNLTGNSYSFGRGQVDYRFTEQCFDTDLLKVISKVHFRINRQEIHSRDGPVVIIEDLSSNGTFINKKPIGKNKKTVLKHNDEIGLAHSDKKVFMFYDCVNNEASLYPETLRAKYTVTKKLGEGTYGEVKLAYRQGSLERCAVKILKKKIMSLQGNTVRMNNISVIENEISLLQSIDHACIVKLWDVFESDDRIFLVMELAEGGDLYDRIVANRRLPEPVAKLYCYQLTLALQHLHSRGIVHRDLKPENVLLSSDALKCCIKLTDFGMSKLTVDASQMSTFCGTNLYLAPDLLQVSSAPYTKKVDMWSFGVVVYVCLAGYPPFMSNDESNLKYLISTGRYNFNNPIWKEVSPLAKAFINSLLVLDPEQRYGADQALQHIWFQGDADMRKEASELMYRAMDPPTVPVRGWGAAPTEDSCWHSAGVRVPKRAHSPDLSETSSTGDS